MDILFFVVMILIILNNSWKIYLALRQLAVCRSEIEPPPVLDNVIKKSSMDEVRKREMHKVEMQIWVQIIDTVFSCIEISLGLYPWLWKLTTTLYNHISDTAWLSLFFVFLYTIYRALRYIPILIYNKLVLTPKYSTGSQESTPFIGSLCVLAFGIVFVQIFFAPLTFIIIMIGDYGGYFFFLWFWVVAIVLSLTVFFILTSCNILFFGKQERLTESTLMDQIEKVTEIAKFPISRVYLLYTYHLRRGTAYVNGFCCCQRLLIVDTMINSYSLNPSYTVDVVNHGLGLNDTQIAAVVAHALGHWRYCHLQLIFFLYALLLFAWALIFGAVFHYVPIFKLVGFEHGEEPHIVAYIILLKYLLPLCATIVTPLVLFILRALEYSADRYAIGIGYGKPLLSGTIKLFGDFMTYPFVDRWYMAWIRRRPPILDRVAFLKSLDQPNIET